LLNGQLDDSVDFSLAHLATPQIALASDAIKPTTGER
jgi:hypothetical protein